MSDWRWEYDPDETHVIGGEPPAPPAFVPGGMFLYLTVARHECVYVLQVTPWPA